MSLEIWEETGGRRNVRFLRFKIENSDSHADMIDYLCEQGVIRDFEQGTVFFIIVYRNLGKRGNGIYFEEHYACVANQNDYNTVGIAHHFIPMMMRNLGMSFARGTPNEE